MTDLESLLSARDLVGGLFTFVKAIQMHGARHPAVDRQVEAIAALIAAAKPPFTLQFVGGGVFRDRSLVPLDAEAFRRAAQVSRAFDELQIHELSFQQVPPAATLQGLADALAQSGEQRLSLEDAELTGLRCRSLPGARFGVANEQVDVETFVAAQLTLALEALERANVPDGWLWSSGLGAVRRVDRVVELNPATSLRILEEMSGAWTTARRACSAGLSAATTLAALGVSAAVRRAATHAAMVLTTSGLSGNTQGAPLAEALAQALRMAVGRGRSGDIDPHTLRSLALLHLCASASASASASADHREGLFGLLSLVYGLERRRVRSGVTFTLMRQDLLAEAVQRLDAPDFPSMWVRLLIAANGAIPPGSRVRLSDGRLALVLSRGPSGDPFLPEVLVDRVRLVPESRVMLVALGGSR